MIRRIARKLHRRLTRWAFRRQIDTRRDPPFQPLHWDSPIRQLRMIEIAARKAGV